MPGRLCYCGAGSIFNSLAVGLVIITQREPRIKTNGLFCSMGRMEIDLTSLDLYLILQTWGSKPVAYSYVGKSGVPTKQNTPVEVEIDRMHFALISALYYLSARPRSALWHLGRPRYHGRYRTGVANAMQRNTMN